MRVLLALGWYFPDPAGGTEVYVRGLASRLRRRGVEVSIAAPTDGGVARRYVHDGVPVLRYPVATDPSPAELGGLERPRGFEAWEAILHDARPEVADFHSMTRGVGLPHLRAADESGAKVVLTVHLPGPICPRGTLVRFGRSPCDGDLARQPCTACRLHGRGVPRPLAALAARMPRGLARWSLRLSLPSAAAALLSAPEVHRLHRARLDETFARAARVVAVSRWLADALLRNGLPPRKLALCPQGVEGGQPASPRGSDGRLRVGFIGRYDPAKGIHVLLDAVRRLPAEAAIDCHVWGVGRSAMAQAYRARLERLARGEPRIRFHPPVESSGEPLASLDLLVIPSLSMETGPLVLLEAFAARVPVVGSNLGSIAERVRHGVDGLLVPPGDARALADALLALRRNPTRLEALRAGISPVRTMDDVATETRALYADVLEMRRPTGVVGADARQ